MEIQKQPTDDTCGATTLHAMYQHLGVDVPIDILVKTITQFPNGGTADVYLAMDALERGLKVTVYTSNIRVFDPSWLGLPQERLVDRLYKFSEYIRDKDLIVSQIAGLFSMFVRMGGRVRINLDDMGNLITALRYGPVIAGVSYDWLMGEERDNGGDLTGHFIIVDSYDDASETFTISDPWDGKKGQHYKVSYGLMNKALLLGTLTNDGSFILIEKGNDGNQGN